MDALQVSERLTRLVLGLDALYKRERTGGDEQHLDREGLVPVHWSPLEPLSVEDWAEGKRLLRRTAEDAAVLDGAWARDWLTEYALSVLTLVRWLSGEAVAYEEVVAGAVRVDPRPADAAMLRACSRRRDDALEAAGYRSYDAYVEANAVPAENVKATMERLIAEAEARTRARMPRLRLPAERIGVEVVDGTPFGAYCDYPGKRVWINTDVSYTAAELKHLVGHEAYPGHYAHMGHRDALVQRGDMLPDAAIVFTNTASSVLFEGIAERGLDMLGWRDTPEDVASWWHHRLQWLCSIEAAHALNTGRRTVAEIADFLRTTCSAQESWIDAKIRFVTHALRAPFVYAYWWGGTVVGTWWRRVPADRLNEAFDYLYGRMHSPTTLAAHWAGEETP